MSNAIPNIKGSLPQAVASIKTKIDLNMVYGKKEKEIAFAIINSFFQKQDDFREYKFKLNIKQIDLILGRLESLLGQKISEIPTLTKDNVKELIAEAVLSSTLNLKQDIVDAILDSVTTILNENIEDLKKDILDIFQTNIDSISITKQKVVKKVVTNVSNQKENKNFPVKTVIDNSVIDKVNKDNSNNDIRDNKTVDKPINNEVTTNIKANNDGSKPEPIDISEIKEDLLEDGIGTTEVQENESFLSTPISYEENSDNTDDSKSDKDSFLVVKNEIEEQFEKIFTRINDSIFKVYLLDFFNVITKNNNSEDQTNILLDTLTILKRLVLFLRELNTKIDFIFYVIKKFDEKVYQILKRLERFILGLARKISRIMLSYFPMILVAWYGPPCGFAGTILLVVASIIAFISYLITKYEPVLRYVVMVLLPTLGGIFLALASFFTNALVIIKNVVEIAGEVFVILVETIGRLIMATVKNFVFPVCRLLMDTIDVVKEIISDYVIPVFEAVIKKVIIPLFDKILIPVLEKFLKLFVDVVMYLVDELLVPFLGKILVLLKEFLDFITPYIKPLVDVVFTVLYALLRVIKKIVIPLAKFLANSFIFLIRILDTIWSFFSKILNYVGDFIEIITSLPSIIYEKIMSILPEWLKRLLFGLGQFIGMAVDSFLNALGVVGGAFKAVGAAVKEFWNFLTRGEDYPLEKARENYKWLKNRWKETESIRKIREQINFFSNEDVIEYIHEIPDKLLDLVSFLNETFSKIVSIVKKMGDYFYLSFDSGVGLYDDDNLETAIEYTKSTIQNLTKAEIVFNEKPGDIDLINIDEINNKKKQFLEEKYKPKKNMRLEGFSLKIDYEIPEKTEDDIINHFKKKNSEYLSRLEKENASSNNDYIQMLKIKISEKLESQTEILKEKLRERREKPKINFETVK